MHYISNNFNSMLKKTKQGGHKLLKYLSDKNFHTSKFYNLWMTRRYVEGKHKKGHTKKLLLVYSMPKVGSSTIYVALRRMQLQWPSLHTHSLHEEMLAKNEVIYKRNWHKGMKPTQIWQSQYVLREIRKGMNNTSFKIITLVRDPIARNVSHFFETLYLVNDYDYRKKMRFQSIDDTVKEITPLFFDHFLGHDVPLHWFDRELKAIFDTDVFNVPFLKFKGYQVYQGEKAEVLVIRLEDLNECVDAAIRDFLGIKGLQLVRSNMGADKDYSRLYRAFLENLTLPKSYLNEMYESKYARHFYTPEEIENFKRKWSHGPH